MNKKLLSVLIAICITAISCKDKGDAPVPQKEKSPLLGRWIVTESYTDTNINGTFEPIEKEFTGPDDTSIWEFFESGELILFSTYRGIDSVLLKDTSKAKWAESEDGNQLLLLGTVWNIDGTTRDTTYVDIISLSNDMMTLEYFYTYILKEDSLMRVKHADELKRF